MLRLAWTLSFGVAVALRAWNALCGPMLLGYDGWAHIAYVLFLDLYQAVPFPDQGWSYFHPPLYYLLGALLARAGDADVLARGLALLGSAASLGIALLAAAVVACDRREPLLRSRAACVAFTGVGFLPVLVYTSPMPGNEMLAAFLATTTVALFLHNESRAGGPSRARDLATALAAGAAVLTKVSALVPVAAIGAAALLQALRSTGRFAALRRLVGRAAAMGVVFVTVVGPYYGRNVAHFGTPFVTSHEHPKVEAMEAGQPPGERSWRDFVALPGAALLHDSRFDAPHVIRSVWGSAYLNTWFDTYRASHFPRWLPGVEADHPIHRETLLLAGLGLVPTAFALFGGIVMIRTAWRKRTAIVETTLLAVALASLAFFAAFAVRIPTFAAVKASYLLALSLPFGFALARGVELAFASPRPVARAAAGVGCAAVGAGAVATSLVFASGLLYPARPDHRDVPALRAHFGEVEAVRAWFAHPDQPRDRHAIELMAATELAAGDAERATALLRRVSGGSVTPEFVNALGVAFALRGDLTGALQIFERAGPRPALAETALNRGVVRAALGDTVGAHEDVSQAVARSPEIAVAWATLARLEAALGNAAAARTARDRAERLAERPPRHFPYGVGDGDLDYAGRGQRWLLALEGPPTSPRPVLWRPERARLRPPPPAAP